MASNPPNSSKSPLTPPAEGKAAEPPAANATVESSPEASAEPPPADKAAEPPAVGATVESSPEASAEPPPPGEPAKPPPAEPPRLGAAAAQLIIWVAFAAVNAVFIARLPSRGGGADIRVAHHFYDAGQFFAAGALAAALVHLFQRFGPRRWVWAYVALWALSLGLATQFIPIDVASLAERLGGDRWAGVLRKLMVFGFSLGVPVAALTGRFARSWLRWAGVTVAVAGAILNNLVMPNDYRGVHMFAGLTAAALGGSCLVGMRLPAFTERKGARIAALAAHAAIALLGAAAVIVAPSQRVRMEIYRVDGAIMAPIVARLRTVVDRHEVAVPPEAAAWYRDRSSVPAIAPSSPKLLSDDAIVLLITADSMRASLFSDPKTRAKLPRLEQLRSRAVDFTVARSPAPRTVQTWASVFTGKYYSAIEWSGINLKKDPTVRFPMLLAKAGIPSVNIVSCGQMGKFNMRGGFTEEINIARRAGQDFPTSTEAMPRIIERLKNHGKGPLFLFAHLMDPHFPYDSITDKGSKFDRFVAEVGEVDRQIGLLWDALEASGMLDRTTFIISADHGEAFGQHNTIYHTVTLYEELLRVPLFVRVPGVKPRKVDTPVTLMDLGPTILDLFGVATPGIYMGESLTPYLRGENPVLTRPIAAERPTMRALYFGRRKAIVASLKGTLELYDLATDPNETRNLIDDAGPEGEAQIQLLRVFFDAHAIAQ
jgi:hypothetical protein